MDNFTKDIAIKIKEKEDSYDESMRGAILIDVIDRYVEAYGEKFLQLFNDIFEKQEEAYGSYGDYDYSATKLKVSGRLRDEKYFPEKEYEEINRAILLNNIFSDNYFLIIENELKHKDSDFSDVNYYVYLLDKQLKMKSINLETSKYLNSDKLLLKYEYFNKRNLRLGNRYIKYKVFEMLIFTLSAIVKSINRKENGE